MLYTIQDSHMLLFDYSVSNSVHTHMFKLVATLCLIVRACIHIVNTIIIKIIFIVITKWFSQDVHINTIRCVTVPLGTDLEM